MLPLNLPAGLSLDAGLVARHFVAQGDPGRLRVTDLDLAVLPPPVRGSFVHDGTLEHGTRKRRAARRWWRTQAVEFPVEADPDEEGWLGIPAGTTAVPACGDPDAATRELLVEADSLVILDRLPERFVALLSQNPKAARPCWRRRSSFVASCCGTAEPLPAECDRRAGGAGRAARRAVLLAIHADVPVMCIKDGATRCVDRCPG